MSLLSSALTSIGASLLGTSVSKGFQYLKGFLPEGAQSFLGDIGLTKNLVGEAAEKAAKAKLDRYNDLEKDMPKPTMNSVGNSMAAGSMTGAGAGAQMLPLGGTDRVSRALQDARVAEKIMRMTGQAPIPTLNIRMGQTIGLDSATAPRTSLTKKFSN
jgi:hypothetical protein